MRPADRRSLLVSLVVRSVRYVRRALLTFSTPTTRLFHSGRVGEGRVVFLFPPPIPPPFVIRYLRVRVGIDADPSDESDLYSAILRDKVTEATGD
jgi:hypothetical protein